MPNLDALSPPRPVLHTAFKDPHEIRETRDASSVLVADNDKGAPAWQVWLNNARRPQQLPSATASATCVLPLGDHHDTDGGGKELLIVSSIENRVERTGSIAWKRTDMKSPYACVAVGDTVLVTELSGGQVTRLDMRTGSTIDAFGKGMLKQPWGIAVGPKGEIVVVDNTAMVVQVFDNKGIYTRTLGQGQLQYPYGVSVDSTGRVYVTDYDADAVVVFDGVSGMQLKSLTVEGQPGGVCVTRQGRILVTLSGGELVMLEC